MFIPVEGVVAFLFLENSEVQSPVSRIKSRSGCMFDIYDSQRVYYFLDRFRFRTFLYPIALDLMEPV